MNSDQIHSFPTLPDEVFDSLPKSIHSYIRYLETPLQQQQVQIHQLEIRVHDPEAHLPKDGSNSSSHVGARV